MTCTENALQFSGVFINLCWLFCRCKVVALDMRHHGESRLDSEDGEINMSRETLQTDVLAIWTALFGDTQPPTVLVGHSLGGAVAIWTALAKDGIPTLEGLIVIDVVEGTAVGTPPSSLTPTTAMPCCTEQVLYIVRGSCDVIGYQGQK